MPRIIKNITKQQYIEPMIGGVPATSSVPGRRRVLGEYIHCVFRQYFKFRVKNSEFTAMDCDVAFHEADFDYIKKIWVAGKLIFDEDKKFKSRFYTKYVAASSNSYSGFSDEAPFVVFRRIPIKNKKNLPPIVAELAISEEDEDYYFEEDVDF